MVCATNVGGMTVEQAMIKGTADATITAASVLKDAIGYGKDGERIVGKMVDRTPKVFTVKQSENSVGFDNRQYDCGFRPSIVIIKPTRTNASNSSLGSCGRVDSSVYSPMNGSGSYEFGMSPTLGIKWISNGAEGAGGVAVKEINNNGFTLYVVGSSNYWTTQYVTEFDVIAYP